jgi:hypothetical protein
VRDSQDGVQMSYTRPAEKKNRDILPKTSYTFYYRMSRVKSTYVEISVGVNFNLSFDYFKF